MERLKDEEPEDPEEQHKKEVFLVKRKTIELNEFPKSKDLLPSDETLGKSLEEDEEGQLKLPTTPPVEIAPSDKID
jgi:hypothetical protein